MSSPLAPQNKYNQDHCNLRAFYGLHCNFYGFYFLSKITKFSSLCCVCWRDCYIPVKHYTVQSGIYLVSVCWRIREPPGPTICNETLLLEAQKTECCEFKVHHFWGCLLRFRALTYTRILVLFVLVLFLVPSVGSIYVWDTYSASPIDTLMLHC